jgi:hypothetical protein
MAIFPGPSPVWQSFPAQNDLAEQSTFLSMPGISRSSTAVAAEPSYSMTSPPMSPQEYLGTSILESHSMPPVTAVSAVSSPSMATNNLFRPSKWEYQPNYHSLNQTNSFCQTAIFKK